MSGLRNDVRDHASQLHNRAQELGRDLLYTVQRKITDSRRQHPKLFDDAVKLYQDACAGSQKRSRTRQGKVAAA